MTAARQLPHNYQLLGNLAPLVAQEAPEDARCGSTWSVRDTSGRWWRVCCIKPAGHDSRCVDQRGRVGL